MITADGTITTSDPDPGAQVHIVSDSDDLFFLSLAPLYKELETFRPHHSNDALDIARLTMLPHVKVSPFIEPLDRLCTRLHYGAMMEATWQPVVQLSEVTFRRVRTMRALMQIWELLKAEGCRQAARLISLALFTLKRPNSFLIEQSLTIFVPHDIAIQSLPHGEFGRLLDRKFRGHLLRAMLGHVAMEADISQGKGEMEYKSLRGSRIHLRTVDNELYVNERGRVVKDLRCGRHRVCVVDLVLDSGAPAARTERLARSCFT